MLYHFTTIIARLLTQRKRKRCYTKVSMSSVQLPKNKLKAEIFWQTLDVTVVLTVVCLILAFFTRNFVLSMLLCGLSLVSIVVYFLVEYKLEYKLVKAKRIQPNHNPAMEESRTNLLFWGIVIAGLAIGNFFLHFARHGVVPHEIPTTAPLYKDAIALTFLTIVACLLAHALHHSYHFSKNLQLAGIHQARTIKSYVLAFLYTFIGVYVLLLVSSYHADLVFALLAAVFYIGFREFQRYDRKNHRKSVHRLHKKVSTK